MGILIANMVTALSPKHRVIAKRKDFRRCLLRIALGQVWPSALHLGSRIGSTVGWQYSFAALSALVLVAVVLVAALAPNAPGQAAESRLAVSICRPT
ncbi:hypothetical protein [Mycolicibacterium aubagnense]|uniref:Major facilitator superfamily (MFS) profile domain-containing protein n=1 Tax=Mycolicibacterium aubagnense TaxID=319707 RepID=A0ABM9SD31_9MYCO|nr:hypothetical protein [Mycolicibacterium aubagnense]MBN9636249.1 hypothetical protein [Actinomycetota bacterium]TLH64417.1 hypothetical protein C1S80_12080 [Mycolicibacterium aubagnense]WGI35927.1 hypothetical protein QDT91_28370 [Mycolicibacterium aubagnense]BBX82147.1 hypothetical protein MAUB_00200 [Mycolicibacterium aubagnense]